MSVPHRHDLMESSCVNKEITISNRKVRKWAKALTNTTVLDIIKDKSQYTKHGLHLNADGKHKMAEKISEHIKYVTQARNSKPIVMSWLEETRKEKEKEGTGNSEATKEVHHNKTLPVQETFPKPSKEADDMNTNSISEHLTQDEADIPEKEASGNYTVFLGFPTTTIIPVTISI